MLINMVQTVKKGGCSGPNRSNLPLSKECKRSKWAHKKGENSPNNADQKGLNGQKNMDVKDQNLQIRFNPWSLNGQNQPIENAQNSPINSYQKGLNGQKKVNGKYQKRSNSLWPKKSKRSMKPIKK